MNTEALQRKIEDLEMRLEQQRVVSIGHQAIITALHATHPKPDLVTQAVLDEFGAAIAAWQEDPQASHVVGMLTDMAHAFADQHLESRQQADTTAPLPGNVSGSAKH